MSTLINRVFQMDGLYVERSLRQLPLKKLCEHSFKDYHVRGVNYLCLERSCNITTKVYLLDPVEHGKGYVANPHNHRYHFKTTVLNGSLKNLVFEERQAQEDHSDLYWKYAYFHHTHQFERLNKVLLHLNHIDHCEVGESYDLSPNEIHTIQVSEKEPTVLFLQQYPDVVPESYPGEFYCRESSPPNVDGLYQRYSEEEVRDLREKILQLICK
ncbi:predicted protein [Naegleria gruberi]|uniref:Predicted protein n=1 Tax=Naegleria gruberi TaxID=5762 RepID=D2V5H0_NAEGR|nr:uncharacterized protein NAEGRDRAFT_63819 [Naegleria gruberi]EFC48113.1 predicted protein [Naegleria gruberi]|eukprot:XP_002680857.1 predicted protein [Naegleria gruberi strain NEG-M]